METLEQLLANSPHKITALMPDYELTLRLPAKRHKWARYVRAVGVKGRIRLRFSDSPGGPFMSESWWRARAGVSRGTLKKVKPE